MIHKILVLTIGLLLSTGLWGQNLADIFIGVDTVYTTGAPGNLSPLNANASPLISSNPCSTPQQHFAIASNHQNGKVIALAHEGLLSDGNAPYFDNQSFLLHAITWLKTGSNLQVHLKNGWLNSGNSTVLQNALTSSGYSFGSLSSLTPTALANTDVLILGNDWNGQQPYSAAELTAIEAFVANGGGLLIAGLGWSWPGNLSDYPMNAVANLFGIAYQNGIIADPYQNLNGRPKFFNFYPDNINGNLSPYCPSPYTNTNFGRGDTLRIMRLAVSTNGEFTQQNGGLSNTSQLIDQWLEEINDLYGREYCVRFELIPNNDVLLYPDPATDPWGSLPPGSGGCTNANIILDDQGPVIDNAIGASNYDISHVIVGAPFGGGCAGSLKTGVSGGLNIPVTRHEIGHQFSQAHTIARADNLNYEPENGNWSIQGGNSQGYAHAVSYHELANLLRNSIPQVGTKVPTGNTIPTVDAGPDYVIPISTPFTLTGTGFDPDAGDSLTYIWDNMSPGITQSMPITDDSQGALFMRLLPRPEPSRIFPPIQAIIANSNSNAQVQLPTQPRYMDFRLTVNDNHKMLYNGATINASGSNSDDVKITVANAGPFVVTSQSSSGISYLGGSTQTISWEVNGTNMPPIDAQEVTIHLSVDGGYSYPYLLSSGSPNTGSAMVSLPNVEADSARIKVAARGNIFFDLNASNFSIQLSSSTTTASALSPVEIFPNPAQTHVEISVGTRTNYLVELFDATGRRLHHQNNHPHLDVSRYPSGRYTLLITDLTSQERSSHPLVIARQ